jgi:hypothetical protein
MQEYKTTTIQLRSFAEKTLTYHDEIGMQTLVVNLPSREMPKCQEKPSFNKCASLKKNKPNKGAKNQISLGE